MIADMMPHWLWAWLRMDAVTPSADVWTWKHYCRYGRDPSRTADDLVRYLGSARYRRLTRRRRLTGR